MNENKIIFLGFVNNIEEFYSIFGEQINKEIPTLCEDVQFCKNEKIIEISKEELVKFFGENFEYIDIKELREKAIDYFATKIQGEVFDIGKYKNIRINRRARNKYECFSYDRRKLLIVPKLLEILKTSKYKISSEKDKNRKDNIEQFHYFINEVMLNGKEYNVYITIGEDDKGNLFWDLCENKNLQKL
ncbi:MAG: hypothetical protein II816_00685 [Elusimicrobia bacterium]|nr:hypothetical protein [Elusimicrobiota bacterium]